MTSQPWGRRAAPATPHLVAAVVAGLAVGLTAPLLLVGLARRVEGDVSPVLAVLVLLVWGTAVVAIMNLVLPWRRLVAAGVRRDQGALTAVQATQREQTAYHARWLLESSAWALALSLPVLLAVVAVVSGLLGLTVAPRLAWGAFGDLLGVLIAGVSTTHLLRHRG